MRPTLAAFAALCLAGALAACQKSGGDAVSPDDMTMGNPAAKVTMIEYASVACPHCARWNMEVFPAFKAKYVDTGQVRYVAREALTGDDPGLAAAGVLTARCAGKDKYFQVVDAIYRAQAYIFAKGETRQVLLDIARSAGMTEPRFESCIKDDKALEALNKRWEHYVRDDHINATPTFVINGKVYDKGEMSLAELDEAVAKAASGKSAS